MIHYFFETIFKLPQKTLLKKWLKELIQLEKACPGDINFIFCDDEYLLIINQKYLHHDFFTDVITFDYVKGKTLSGDIFISVDRVKDNALKWKQSFESELYRVMAHGVLHLLGYKDKTMKQKEFMRSREDFYLNLLSQKFKCST